MIVDFPHPESPTKAVVPFGSVLRLIPLRTCLSFSFGYAKVTLSKMIYPFILSLVNPGLPLFTTLKS